MAWLQGTYTIRLNHRHKLIGHVLSGRYKAQLVEGSGNGYLESRLGEHHSGELRRETAEAKTERIVSEELRRLGWRESDLASRRKSDPAKLALAARLRQETTLPIKAIAARAHLRTSKSANARLHQWMAHGAAAQAQGQLRL